MKRIIDEYWNVILVGLLISNALAYGLSDFLEYTKTLAIIAPLYFLICWRMFQKIEDPQTEEILSNMDLTIKEQQEVLEEYEKVFDSQLVELPCVCGGNTFQGLFSPKTENVVECEKCKNKYRVTISYDSVLISEPLDINQKFDELVGQTVN